MVIMLKQQKIEFLNNYMIFFFIKVSIVRGNIIFSLLNLNQSIIFFKTIKWFLKYKKIKKPNLKRYSIRLLSSFFLFCFNLIKSFNKRNFYYILIFDNLKPFYNKFLLNLISYHRLRIKLFKILYLVKNSHGYIRQKKLRRL